MKTIEQLLGDLLLRHNCVIVPAFGGFVAQQVSARIDYATGKMFPPYKSLLFNKQLVNNDGLLVTEFSRANGLPYEEALAQVRGKVADWNALLKGGQRIELDRIGYLFLDEEKNLCFEQDRFFNLLLESYGLGKVHFLTEDDVRIVEHTLSLEVSTVREPEEEIAVPVITEMKKAAEPISPQPVLEVVKKPRTVSEKTPVVSRRRAWRYVAAACLLPVAFYSLWIPMRTDVLESGVLSIQDFNPFHAPVAGSYEKEDIQLPAPIEERAAGLEEQVSGLDATVDLYTYAYTEALNIPVKLEPRSQNETAPEVTPVAPAVNNPQAETPKFTAHSMHFIVGCFGQEVNARNLVDKLKAEGFDARILDVQNGLHRVTAGGAVSVEALVKIQSAAEAAGYSGWILK